MLPPVEREVAESMRGFRQESYVGGRLAAGAALGLLGLPRTPITMGPRGEPIPPRGVSLSISHKRHMAVALAARCDHGVVGVDLEDLEPSRMAIASRILQPCELEEVLALPEERQWTATVVRFAIKEAIYKALAPRLGRYMGFDEAIVVVDMDGTAEVTMSLTEGTPPVSIEARYGWLFGAVLATVRAKWPDA